MRVNPSSKALVVLVASSVSSARANLRAKAVTDGPFRFLKHPNYLAVMIETIALPMLHTAWLTALVFGVMNGLLLRQRIRVEEAALREHTNYDEAFS